MPSLWSTGYSSAQYQTCHLPAKYADSKAPHLSHGRTLPISCVLFMNETASQPHVFLCAHRHPDMLTLSNFAPHPMLSAKFHLRRNCGKAEQNYSALSNSFTSSPSQLMQQILKCVNRTGTDLLALLCQGMGALRSLLPQPAPPGATTPVSMAPARGLSPPPCRAVSEHPSPSSSDPDPLLWADIPSPSWGR